MKRKIIKTVTVIILAAAISGIVTLSAVLTSMQNRFDKNLYNNVIRLHIPANSDAYDDQMLKERVRDAVVPFVSELTSDARNMAAAKQILEDNLEVVSKLVKDEIQRAGYNYPADLTVCKEYYPVRYYDGFVFPSGVYTSLKIVLGEGKGKNWWCVLYPSVCTSLASDVNANLINAGIEQDTADAICDASCATEFSFYFLELFQNLKQYLKQTGGKYA